MIVLGGRVPQVLKSIPLEVQSKYPENPYGLSMTGVGPDTDAGVRAEPNLICW